ncbi:unnamed protein product, partial [Sphacelaria rigidula]
LDNVLAVFCRLAWIIMYVPQRIGIAGLYGLAGTDNTSGDQVKKLDILSNDIMISALTESHMCAVLVSEENEEPIIIENSKSGK